MANSRAIRNRIKTVTNTGKITRTMAMVSTTKATKAVGFIKASRPYSSRLATLLSSFAAELPEHPLLLSPQNAERKLLVVVTANRGLCGGYNANIIKVARQKLDEKTDVVMIGKKGVSVFRFLKLEVSEKHIDFPDIPTFESISSFADLLMDKFLSGNYKSVSIAYSKFISAGQQKPICDEILPLKIQQEQGKACSAIESLFEPNKEEILSGLIPKSFRNKIYQCLLDCAASEHLARQLAMSAASDSANDMVKSLTLSFNRARQSQITTEISEIVGGAEALN